MTNPNGRINLIETNNNSNFLQSKSLINETSNYNEALVGTHECSSLSQAYFSKENMQIIQNAIRAEVYLKSNKEFVIAQQDITNLKIIMRAIYLQNTHNLKCNISDQIQNINNIVVDYCVPKLLSEAKAYIKYKHDVSTLVTPLDNPNHSGFKNKTAMFNRFF
tara:strand:+ start:136 stop:624 length:489 start_codon:yes stop_codon:yes gene_type:complete